MKISIQDSNSIIIETEGGKRFRVQTGQLVSEYLYISREDGAQLSVSGFTDRVAELGQFKDIKVR